MVDNAATMARVVGVPLIADADTGYGNELNVTRTVREYEARGVAAIHIEDQVSPKRCGHLDGKEVVSRAEFVSKIRAAVEARRTNGVRDHRPHRCARHARASTRPSGAATRRSTPAPTWPSSRPRRSLEEVAAVPKRVKGPCLLNVVPGGRTPIFDLREAEAMGYKLAILPGLMLAAAIQAGDAALAAAQGHAQGARGHAERGADLPPLRRRRVGRPAPALQSPAARPMERTRDVMAGRTLFDKIWDAHVVRDLGDGWALLHIDRHLLHDLSGPPALAEVAAARPAGA